MKKLLGFLTCFILLSITSFAQFPNLHRDGNSNTLSKTNGAWGSDSGYVFIYSFADTFAANRGFIKNIPGITIRCVDDIFTRNYNATRWLQLVNVATAPVVLDSSFWRVGGNDTVVGNPYLGTNYFKEVILVTNGQERLILPEDGMVRNGSVDLKNLKYDTLTHRIYYYADGVPKV